MPKVIWKWELDPITEKEFPKNTKFLHVGVQGEDVCIWGLVDTEEKETEIRKLFVIGTGHQISDYNLNYIGTTLAMPPFVWHVFEYVGESS